MIFFIDELHMNRRFVDLTINGRLFPSWILANFKKYKLPSFKLDETIDPCSKSVEKGFRLYQQFLAKYLTYDSPYHNMLIYHGLGSGKTASAINIYNVLYNYTPAWNVFLIVKASLHKSLWLPELEKWLSQDEMKFRMNNITFIHYDSPFADKEFMDAVRVADSSKKNLYIIDECHNFIRNVYGNITSGLGKRAQVIYDYMIQDQKDNEGVRILLLSGTPAVNSPYELALLFNLLRPDIFPKSETAFNQMFVSTTTKGALNSSMKNLFQRRILGLASYFIGATPDLYARQTLHEVQVPMSEYQEYIYKHFEDIEAKAKAKAKAKMGQETYRTYTRQACNFVFPAISQNVTGEQRPRPSRFKLSAKEAEKLNEGTLKTDKKAAAYYNVQNYLESVKLFVDSLISYFDKFNSEDIAQHNTISDDLKKYKELYGSDYDAFNKQEKNKSSLFEAMYKSSPKIVQMIFNVMKSQGSSLIYSNYVLMEGIQIIKIYLQYFGFTNFSDGGGKDFFRYSEYHGGISSDIRREYLDKFNVEENKYGKDIKIMLISPAGTEGINLFSIRQIHIFEPYWNEVKITQMIGRGIRQCSHKYLPMNERHVDIFRYKSVRTSGQETTDQYIEHLAKEKDKLINSFLEAVKEASVDCNLNYEVNKLKGDVKCFQFEEVGLLDKQVGPAFKKNIQDDVTLDNGSNSLNSETIKVKVFKISAVKLLSEEEPKKYTKSENYWYNPDTGVVYDFDLHYPIGQVGFVKNENLSDQLIPEKLDQNTYVITEIILIPMI